MGNNIINYIFIGVFVTVIIIVLFYRMNSCDKSSHRNSKQYYITKQDKDFLEKEVYQNVPLINYNYLVNYPNGPHSWGEWSWGSYDNKNKCKGKSNYAIFDISTQVNRNINNI